MQSNSLSIISYDSEHFYLFRRRCAGSGRSCAETVGQEKAPLPPALDIETLPVVIDSKLPQGTHVVYQFNIRRSGGERES